MKLDSSDFRVPAGKTVNLKKWPTLVKPVYKPKKEYAKFLQQYVEEWGSKDMTGCAGEKITEGLDGLREHLLEYAQMCARFAKWCAVIVIGDGTPSRACVDADAQNLARYAALCQDAGLVSIVEPEVSWPGSTPWGIVPK